MSGARKADPDTLRGTGQALRRAYLPDLAADATFEGMIERLRSEPGRRKQ